jgi:Flp pilus assembly protein TadG
MRFRESFRGFGKNQSGTVATEFAIVGTLFCVLMFVMIQMGMVFFSYSVMQNGARDGARRLAVDNDMYALTPGSARSCTPAMGSATVEGYTCSVMLLFADADVTACITDSTPVGGDARYDAEVVVTADMGDVGMFDLFGVSNGVVMTTTAVMRLENGKDPDLANLCGSSIPPLT